MCKDINPKNYNFDYDGIPCGYYDKVFKKKKGIQSKWHNLKFQKITDLLISDVEWNKLLDVACGPGTLISNLPKEKECVGIDISENQIKYARLNNKKSDNHTFVASSALDIQLEGTQFDVVTAIEFIEHLTEENITKFLKEVNRCLKPGGFLVITTPNYGSMWPVLEWIVSRISPVSYEIQHISKFKRNSLKETLHQNNFKITSLNKYLFVAPFFAAFSWNIASGIFRFERRLNTGNLLLAVAQKKQN